MCALGCISLSLPSSQTVVLNPFSVWVCSSFHNISLGVNGLTAGYPSLPSSNSVLSVSVLQVLMFLKGCWPLAPGIIWPLHPPCELTRCFSSPSSSSFRLSSSSIAISLFSDPFAALMSEFFDTSPTIQYELIIPNVSSVPKLLKCILYYNI